MIFPVLYKRTSNGNVQQWQVEVQHNRYRTISGKVGGKLTTSEWKYAKAKNVGRANEVSDVEQANLVASRMWNQRLEGHYFRDINRVDVSRFVKPMLAHKYVNWDRVANQKVYSQPKLDGIRCIVTADGMWSRNGKPLVSAPHIRAELDRMFRDHPDLILDGELYASALSDNFDEICSLAKKTKPTDRDLHESAKHLQYWVYDVVDNHSHFEDRIRYLTNLMEVYNPRSTILTPTALVTSEEHLDELYATYLSSGQEGQMVRDGGASYENKRTTSLLKRKEFQDTEATILEVIEGVGNWSGYAKSLKCQLEDGTIFNAGIKGTFAYCKRLLEEADSIVGNEATIRYQNLTPAGVPRFPVCHHIWEGKRNL